MESAHGSTQQSEEQQSDASSIANSEPRKRIPNKSRKRHYTDSETGSSNADEAIRNKFKRPRGSTVFETSFLVKLNAMKNKAFQEEIRLEIGAIMYSSILKLHKKGLGRIGSPTVEVHYVEMNKASNLLPKYNTEEYDMKIFIKNMTAELSRITKESDRMMIIARMEHR